MDFTVKELKLIRGVGDTAAGKLLLKYIEQDLNEAMTALTFKVDANDSTEIAAMQVTAKMVKKISNLLTMEVSELLKQHNLEDEDE